MQPSFILNKLIPMQSILKFEEFGQFALSIFLFSYLDYAWWVFPACILLPDISMVGYLVNTKTGAMVYNLFHHKLVGISLFISGMFFGFPILSLIGVIIFGHASLDRIFGYGLKYNNHFRNTHLGRVGNKG